MPKHITETSSFLGAASGVATLDADARVAQPVGDSKLRALLAVDPRQIVRWDTFDRPNQSGLGTSDCGRLWVDHVGAQIASGQAAPTTSGGLFSTLTDPHDSNLIEQRIRAYTYQGSSNRPEVVLFFVDVNNFVAAGIWAGRARIRKVVGGVETILATAVVSGPHNSEIGAQFYADVGVRMRTKELIMVSDPASGMSFGYVFSADPDYAMLSAAPANGFIIGAGSTVRCMAYAVLDHNYNGAWLT